MKASTAWLASTGAAFRPGTGRSGWAYLKHYSAEYCEWGSGPPLVLVPGLAGGFELLGPVARRLATRFRVISYQLRGEDNCFALRHRFALDDLVEDLAEFIDWYGLERPAVFGVSFGAVLGLEFAARFPHQLSQLVIQGAGAKFESGLLHKVAGAILSRYPLPADNAFVNQFFNLLFGRRQRPGPLFEFVTRQCWQTDQSVMAHRFSMVEQFDIRPRLDEVQAPMLILAGDRDLLVSEQGLCALCAGIGDHRLVRLPDCGHLAFLTHPHRVAREVQRFLSRDRERLAEDAESTWLDPS